MGDAAPIAWKGDQRVASARRFYLWALTGAHIVVHWYTQLLTLVLPSLKADLGLSNVQVGGITSAFMGVSNAASLPLGYLADSFPRRGAILLSSSLVAFGLATLWLGSAPPSLSV